MYSDRDRNHEISTNPVPILFEFTSNDHTIILIGKEQVMVGIVGGEGGGVLTNS